MLGPAEMPQKPPYEHCLLVMVQASPPSGGADGQLGSSGPHLRQAHMLDMPASLLQGRHPQRPSGYVHDGFMPGHAAPSGSAVKDAGQLALFALHPSGGTVTIHLKLVPAPMLAQSAWVTQT